MVGSDVDNFGCLYCESHDRERHLFMYFDGLGLWEKVGGGRVLHFAPERWLATRIASLDPVEYVRADLHPRSDEVVAIDATALPHEDDHFDLVIANHVLEHIPNYGRALSEFHRVLKPRGVAILQTPYSRLLHNNFEDPNIDTEELRAFFHGKWDHVRTFSERELFGAIEAAGFCLQIIKHGDLFGPDQTFRYGVNPLEDLIRAVKPG